LLDDGVLDVGGTVRQVQGGHAVAIEVRPLYEQRIATPAGSRLTELIVGIPA